MMQEPQRGLVVSMEIALESGRAPSIYEEIENKPPGRAHTSGAQEKKTKKKKRRKKKGLKNEGARSGWANHGSPVRDEVGGATLVLIGFYL